MTEAEAQDDRRSVRRIEDERFLTGRGRYVDDVPAGNDLHAHVVRSPHGHARIARIDAEAARGAPGVRGVFTEADLRADGVGPLPCTVQIPMVTPLVIPPRHALARDRVRHVGDPVALVVATSRDAARDAAELVAVDYEPLPAVVDGRDALSGDAPEIWPEAPGNLAFRFQKGDRAATDAAFAAAARTVAIELVNNRVVPAPLEPRAAIGRYDRDTAGFDLLLTGQGVHGIRRQLATVFGIAAERIHVRAPDVGGGFGMKNFNYPEWVLVLWAARRLGQAVRWTAERGEDFLSSTQGRDNHTRARLALGPEGEFLGIAVETIASMGAYLSSAGPISSTVPASTAIGGGYAIPAAFLDVRGVFTNTVPIDAYRGAGKPESNYLTERLVDAAARETGIDPIAIRRRNLVSRFPYRTAMGLTIDGGRFAANLDDLRALGDLAGFAARRAASRQQGRLRGLGIAAFIETARGQPTEGAAVRFTADDRVEIAVGTQSNGQGHETSFAQLAADQLGLPLDRFRYVQADTRKLAVGAGHGGARSLQMGGTALLQAAQGAVAKGRPIAARLLQADPAEIEFADGRYMVRGTGRAVDLLAVARAAADAAGAPDGAAGAIDTEATNPSDLFTFPNGCHAAEVEIDPETGAVTLDRYTAVDDYGRLVNPMLTEGQIHGGLAQGIGQAMLERTVYDPDSAQLLTGSFMDYALPRATDLPALRVAMREDRPTASNPLGVKGSGQAGAIAAPQTVVNAVIDALAPLGIRHVDMPVTPE
ncbi:MAG: xanthine dehydrogenase family protein molybdopterin-binding subunit, partial [Alphaproteobacteria bacterium]|nr:xanthine dehydrogenase family protein molybdopterin-binding subunit [Alphaproteobacteria bacterium]